MRPSKRYGHTATPIGQNVYVFGGRADVRVNDLYVLNFERNTCTQIKHSSTVGTPPSPRSNHTAVNYKENLYIFGGESDEGTLLNDLYQFNTRWQRASLFRYFLTFVNCR